MGKKEHDAWLASSIDTGSVEDDRREAEGDSTNRSNRSDNRSKDRSCSPVEEVREEAVRVVLVEEDHEDLEGAGRDPVDPWGEDG